MINMFVNILYFKGTPPFLKVVYEILLFWSLVGMKYTRIKERKVQLVLSLTFTLGQCVIKLVDHFVHWTSTDSTNSLIVDNLGCICLLLPLASFQNLLLIKALGVSVHLCLNIDKKNMTSKHPCCSQEDIQPKSWRVQSNRVFQHKSDRNPGWIVVVIAAIIIFWCIPIFTVKTWWHNNTAVVQWYTHQTWILKHLHFCQNKIWNVEFLLKYFRMLQMWNLWKCL